MIAFSADQQATHKLEIEHGCISGLREDVVAALAEHGATVGTERRMLCAGIYDANAMASDITVSGSIVGRMVCYRRSAKVLCTFTL